MQVAATNTKLGFAEHTESMASWMLPIDALI
ncbi:hypothetical protein N482_14660 [Pseudoalteromonas luteoviolacea NCIMB 1942]|uniref:Uncharacterized protein n=1 Tax=Pseudoalteromonas luteoviolacea NCIMB 1942 TaxID=1365253 RepID=A0A167AJT2_9GAMM|nr:hypothetical protein N482_14660 [Pseudoalteromonas luteoviolacea NCIMB 1942]